MGFTFVLILMASFLATVMADDMDEDLDLLGYIFDLLGAGLHLVSDFMDSDDDGSQGRSSPHMDASSGKR
ncbi:hypothetical protein HDE_09869 [Halotydeus destructor]|nr:hypothetical protein HDE_09869 [Halotydeus destructor]